MDENTLKTEAEGLNMTDPVVKHDGGRFSNIAVMYDPEFNVGPTDGTKPNTSQDFDQTKMLGKRIPVIKLNNLVIDYAKIEYIKLDYTGFIPMLTLWVKDADTKIKTQDMPTRNNIITLVIVPQEEGAYKKISLDFYTNTVPERHGDIIKYTNCEYHIPELYSGGPRLYKHAGCGQCGTSQNNKPNTFELFHDLALELGLGYQTTGGVQDVEDRLIRNTMNSKLYEFMKEQIAMGGTNETEFFDAWIDLYGYLTVVNIPWVLSQDIDHNYLGIKALPGMPTTSLNVLDQNYRLIHRTINNFNENPAPVNLSFVDYEHLIDYSSLKNKGSIQNFYSFQRAGDPMANADVGGNNFDQVNLQAAPSSYDEADLDSWQTGTKTVILTNVNDYPTATQKAMRDLFFTNLRTQRLKVEMQVYNLGLQRGTLVNFIDFNYDTMQKQSLSTNFESIFDETEDFEFDQLFENFDMQMHAVMDPHFGMPNFSTNGIYYIDGMEFIYEKHKQQIVQYVYLIPRKPTNRPTNKNSTPKFAPENIQ